MKYADMAAVVGAAILVATFSAQMAANALVPSVDLASGDARLHIDAARTARLQRGSAPTSMTLAQGL